MTQYLLQKKIINNITEQSGCYLFKDKVGQVIYIGKAINLKNRLISYFSTKNSPKIEQLMQEATAFSIIETQNEKSALILEFNLIKQYKPRYNFLLSDDRIYPYIKITNEKHPRYQLIRRTTEINNYCFGPFPDGSGAKEVLTMLERLFPLRKCNNKNSEPCFYYKIKMCSGACFKNISQKYYDDVILKIRCFFQGNTREIIKKLKTKIQLASQLLQFEEAERCKNLIEKIKLFKQRQFVQLKSQYHYDFLNFFINKNYITIGMQFFRYGKLQLIDKEFYFLGNEKITEIILLYLQQIYLYNTKPHFLFIPEEINKKFLGSVFNNIKLITPKRGIKKQILQSIQGTIYDYYQEQILKNHDPDILLQLKKLLNLETVPKYIDMVDISNYQDSAIVGSVVRFNNGIIDYQTSHSYPLSNDNFKKGDVWRMNEALTKHFIINQKSVPELLIVDGGISHVRMAQKLLIKHHIMTTTILGLVKNIKHETEYLLTSDGKKLYAYIMGQKLFNFLALIQTKTHFFALRAHKKLFSRQMKTSILDNIRGLGKINKKKLLILLENDTFSHEEIKKIIKQDALVLKILSTVSSRKNNS
jgi:excinuclease ABC subunit C